MVGRAMTSKLLGMLASPPAICLLATVAAGFSAPAFAADLSAATVAATVLWYQEQEPGADSYPVKITITDDFMRIDAAEPESGFILFDRGSHTIYSVSHDDRSILAVSAQPADLDIPPAVRLDELVAQDPDAPPINGRQPLHVQARADGKACFEVIAVPGLLEPAVAALTDFARITGAQQAGHLKDMPAEIQTPCYLLRYVYGTGLPYQRGLPVREWDVYGYNRELNNYQHDMPVAAGLFELPSGYQQYRIGD